MPNITSEELKQQYPMMYRAFKTAEDFNNSPHILRDEMRFIIKICEEDPTRKEEMALRLAICHEVAIEMINMVEKGKKLYIDLIKILE